MSKEQYVIILVIHYNLCTSGGSPLGVWSIKFLPKILFGGTEEVLQTRLAPFVDQLNQCKTNCNDLIHQRCKYGAKLWKCKPVARAASWRGTPSHRRSASPQRTSWTHCWKDRHHFSSSLAPTPTARAGSPPPLKEVHFLVFSTRAGLPALWRGSPMWRWSAPTELPQNPTDHLDPRILQLENSPPCSRLRSPQATFVPDTCYSGHEEAVLTFSCLASEFSHTTPRRPVSSKLSKSCADFANRPANSRPGARSPAWSSTPSWTWARASKTLVQHPRSSWRVSKLDNLGKRKHFDYLQRVPTIASL